MSNNTSGVVKPAAPQPQDMEQFHQLAASGKLSDWILRLVKGKKK